MVTKIETVYRTYQKLGDTSLKVIDRIIHDITKPKYFGIVIDFISDFAYISQLLIIILC